MSAERLRQAATLLRVDADDPETSTMPPRTALALADWLDEDAALMRAVLDEANEMERMGGLQVEAADMLRSVARNNNARALTVANAILGDAS